MVTRFQFLAKKFIVLLFFIVTSPTCVFATTGHPYLGSTLGTSIGKIDVSHFQINYDNGLLNDAYPLNHNSSITAVVGLNGGYQFARSGKQPIISLGLGVYTTPTNYTYHGQLIETASGDPSSILYNYTYDINSTRLMAELKFSWIIKQQFVTYADVGVGPAWNYINSYTETPVDNEGYAALQPFQSKTQMNFSYQVGLGLGYLFNFVGHNTGEWQEQLSLGYRYVNLGSGSFGTRGADYPFKLNIGRLTSNEVYIGYTHFL